METEILFATRKNGHELIILQDEGGHKDVIVKMPKREHDIMIYVADGWKAKMSADKEEYSKIGFRIGTVSIGSQPTYRIKQLMEEYSQAIEAVLHFEFELARLELVTSFSK